MAEPKKALAAGAAAALAGGLVIGAALGIPGISSAQSPGSSTTTTAPASSRSSGQGTDPGAEHHHDGARHGETELTGTDADKAKAAALAAVPGGTVERVSADTDGAAGAAYEAHVTKADGSRVEVQMDKGFKVLTVDPDQQRPGGPGGHRHDHGWRGGPGNGENELSGADADKAKTAAQGAVPGGTVEGVSADRDGASGSVYEAHATKSDGSKVEVQLDKDFKVLSVNADDHRMGSRR